MSDLTLHEIDPADTYVAVCYQNGKQAEVKSFKYLMDAIYYFTGEKEGSYQFLPSVVSAFFPLHTVAEYLRKQLEFGAPFVWAYGPGSTDVALCLRERYEQVKALMPPTNYGWDVRADQVDENGDLIE